jgi:hypothetical protein
LINVCYFNILYCFKYVILHQKFIISFWLFINFISFKVQSIIFILVNFAAFILIYFLILKLFLFINWILFSFTIMSYKWNFLIKVIKFLEWINLRLFPNWYFNKQSLDYFFKANKYLLVIPIVQLIKMDEVILIEI